MKKATSIVSTIAIATLFCFEFVGTAQATLFSYTGNASNSAIVQPAGPRLAPGGKQNFNVVGSTNAANSSFGVLDFNLATVIPAGNTATSVGGALLQLTESNTATAPATAPGPVSIYLSTQTGVSIESTNTTLNYVSGQNSLASVDSDLGTLTLLGSGTFNTTGAVNNGSLDVYTLNFSGTALTAMLNTLNSHGTLRLVLTPDNATTAATWAGISSTAFAPPQLGFIAVATVPEPASLLLLGLGGIGLVAGARLIKKS